ncbi:1074_t:CDS:2 [Acaulospora morrowiae]|uniref:1074_t:CDS:1 n=1 Tax=Acaulospora morrowiae TaxID=94023 RepID=A0A9N9G0X6_9GLOM|nr:1074_t:CDS:2 [Acaulospora morrowiae]
MFLVCKECGEYSNSEDIWVWCKPCNARHFQEKFGTWTSGNSVIDKFIQETQLSASDHFQKLEWIPYNLFTDVTYLSQGGFGKVYKAIWKRGYIYKWDIEKKDWSRRGDLLGDTKVVLKSLYNSEEIYSEFFDEIRSQLKSIIVKRGYRVIPCYGITRNPESSDFMMVMRYAEEGSLRHYLDKNFHSLDWYQKLKILYMTLRGLEDIHNAGLTHRDFHGGNIVLFNFEDACITDFGLCKPITSNELKYQFGKWFGVYDSKEYDEFWDQVKEIERWKKTNPTNVDPSGSGIVNAVLELSGDPPFIAWHCDVMSDSHPDLLLEMIIRKFWV